MARESAQGEADRAHRVSVERVFILRTRGIVNRMIAYVWSLAGGDLVEVVVRPHTKKRTTAQNRRYWAALREIAEQYRTPRGVQCTEEQLHEQFKRHLIGQEEVEDIFTGEIQLRPISTTKLNTTEFADYTTQVEAWAASEGVEFSPEVYQFSHE